MTIVDDITLLLKKIGVSVIIYLIPVTILVSGLLLTRYLLDDDDVKNSVSITTKP